MLVRRDADVKLPGGIGDAHPAIGRESGDAAGFTPALNPERLDRARRIFGHREPTVAIPGDGGEIEGSDVGADVPRHPRRSVLDIARVPRYPDRAIKAPPASRDRGRGALFFTG
jgi:hypothetical protein